MIREVKGNLVKSDAHIICHQANFHGIMGGGVALSIWNELLPFESRMQYQKLCADKGRNLLGTVQYIRAARRQDGNECIVANLFCQDEETQADGGLTRYDCMRKCLQDVESVAREQECVTVALPGYMGCGIAGGNWDKVYSIIVDVFATSAVELNIVFWDKQTAW